MNKEQLMAMGLTEEQAQQILDGFGTMVPKSRLDDKIKELKTTNDTIAERDTQLEELKPKAAGNEALQAEITRLQQENKDNADKHAADLSEQQRSFALENALKEAKVHNPKSVKALLDLEKVKLNGEALEGLTEQLEALKQSDAYLFEQEQQQQPPSFSGGQHTPPAQPTDTETWMAAFK
ncbi:phage scaffolding protein [Lysinibacillus sp. NPDC096418]|uniref:phage scaffolding protein n=1 Tax=Lysinibacillus sp. NPDC096418 TaxID=3364138 RepID=UPI0037F33F96